MRRTVWQYLAHFSSGTSAQWRQSPEMIWEYLKMPQIMYNLTAHHRGTGRELSSSGTGNRMGAMR